FTKYRLFFTKENLFRGNGPCHLLLGASSLSFLCAFPLVAFGEGLVWLTLVLALVSGLGVGILLELFEVKWCEAIGSEIDVFTTSYGSLLAWPLCLLLIFLGLPPMGFIVLAIIMAMIAFLIHK